jgi:hypothetical protein
VWPIFSFLRAGPTGTGPGGPVCGPGEGLLGAPNGPWAAPCKSRACPGGRPQPALMPPSPVPWNGHWLADSCHGIVDPELLHAQRTEFYHRRGNTALPQPVVYFAGSHCRKWAEERSVLGACLCAFQSTLTSWSRSKNGEVN